MNNHAEAKLLSLLSQIAGMLVATLLPFGANAAESNDSSTLTAAQTASKQIDMAGSIGGIGAKLQQTNGAIRVESIFENSPAGRAGMKAGWEIASINGTMTKGMALADAVKLLRGTIGTQVVLEVLPPGDASRKLTLTREKVLIAPIETRLLDSGLLLIRARRF